MQTDELQMLKRSEYFLRKYATGITNWVEDLVKAPASDIKKGLVPTPKFDEVRLSDYESDEDLGEIVETWRKGAANITKDNFPEDLPGIKKLWFDSYSRSLVYFGLAKSDAKMCNAYIKMKTRMCFFARKMVRILAWTDSDWKNSMGSYCKYHNKVYLFNRFIYENQGAFKRLIAKKEDVFTEE